MGERYLAQYAIVLWHKGAHCLVAKEEKGTDNFRNKWILLTSLWSVLLLLNKLSQGESHYMDLVVMAERILWGEKTTIANLYWIVFDSVLLLAMDHGALFMAVGSTPLHKKPVDRTCFLHQVTFSLLHPRVVLFVWCMDQWISFLVLLYVLFHCLYAFRKRPPFHFGLVVHVGNLLLESFSVHDSPRLLSD